MADDNEFQIKFTVDNTDARAKFKAGDDAMDRATAKADTAAKKMAAAIGTSANSQVQAIGKVDRVARQLGDSHVAAAKKAADAHSKAAAEVAKSWDLAGTAHAKFAEGIKGAVLANLGFGAVVAAVQAVGAAFGESNKALNDYGKDLIKVKDDLKELATLKGLATADDAFIKKVGEFGRATGLTITEADSFQKQFIGSLAAGETKGNIKEDTKEDLMIQGARIASRQTKDMNTRGDLLGVISQFQKLDPGRKGTEQALATAEAVRQALVAGRGDDAPLTKSLLNVAGSFVGDKGPIPTLSEMAAVVGTTSLSAGAGAADSRAEALLRGLRGTTSEQISFLRSIGIGENDKFEVKADKMMSHLAAKQASGRDISTYLTESGFNDEQSRAFAETLPNYGTLKERLKLAREARSGADLIAESDRVALTDPNQRMRLAEADLAAARLARGVERQAIQPDIIAGQAALVARGADTDPAMILGDLARSAGSFGQVAGIETRAKMEALSRLRKQAGVGDGYGEKAARALFGDPGVAVFQGLSSVTGSADRELAELRQAIERQTAAINAQTRAVTGAIDGQTKTLTPPRSPAAPMAPLMTPGAPRR